MISKNKKRVFISLDYESLKNLEAVCSASGFTKSEVIQRSLEAMLPFFLENIMSTSEH